MGRPSVRPELAGAGGAARNIDHFRHAVERIDPVAYLTHGYYGRWLGGIETMIVEAGMLDTRRSRSAQSNSARAPTIGSRRSRLPSLIAWTMSLGAPATGGQSLQLRVTKSATACERGIVARADTRGCPLTRAEDAAWWFRCTTAGCFPTRMRTVAAKIPNTSTRSRSTAANSGATDAEPGVVVHLDLFEPYLERADD